ncbi:MULTISPECIES: aldo/keto reductase [Aliivibrio]|uniref:Aldo/keto reductase family oxidoreductase n=1 Tax=Aliivibrio finisterrensis TaxID=511998 RepID=A0A4Q5KUY1_9GAMM|nr:MULTISPECIES: aldo/keto reductase family oxidoreductase [Aliivibrio]MDD9180208.1 aldo/keto reductase family oxidoreductase [Aliivibrio sp. A6]RYU49362.1 aldo/keto reductase family oxidoreductase [Aliivibrio finisterrensis]RYU49832.1 aldo/keto reductase family oxidoreductase [Aliivibrio finisterrensis]RYU55496.1 aldo/keto reductase family oxidoreductase [Aliivibrio finisterrensis]RYU61862.1 aldo/keto reductase family oxidoreductase [Aliivibrio finisterrensis]
MINKTTIAPQGPEFSELVQGYWRLGDWGMTPQQRLTFLKQHIDLGITTVDHADIYGGYQCEHLFGEALSLEPSVRDQIEIITKCDINLCTSDFPNRKINHYDTSKEHIVNSVNNSLSRLNISEIDVLLIHRLDALMDADEVADTFNQLQKEGKVKHFGVSNFTPSHFDLLQSRLDKPLVTNQVEINPLNFEVAHDGTLDQLQMNRIKPMAWSCLAGGELFSGQSEQAIRVRNVLEELKEEVGAKSIDQVIYAWVRKLPSKPLPIIGSGKIERVRAAVDAMGINLTREQWYRVWVESKGHGVP